MKLALLKGNRFNPWHLQVFNRLPGKVQVTAFRAESEIQDYFHERDDGSLDWKFERIHFDTEAGNPLRRFGFRLQERFSGRQPRILPFHERLEGFDLVHSWELFTDWTAEAVAAKKRYGIPLAVMVWDNIPFNMERNAEGRRLKSEAVQWADRFLVHTERSRRALILEGVSEDRITEINPGVDTAVFSPGEGNRSRFGIEDDEFVILFVGWLLPRKGIDFLILALHELIHDSRLDDIRFRLLVLGSGPGLDRVEGLIDRVGVRDACTLAGSVQYDEMPGAFRSADLFVLPSIPTPEWQEQFGMSLIEAMACGVPIVSTYTGSISEIAGDAAVLCQPNDFVSLYESIRNLALEGSKRSELAEAGRARAVEHFDLDSYAVNLAQVYGALAGG